MPPTPTGPEVIRKLNGTALGILPPTGANLKHLVENFSIPDKTPVPVSPREIHSTRNRSTLPSSRKPSPHTQGVTKLGGPLSYRPPTGRQIDWWAQHQPHTHSFPTHPPGPVSRRCFGQGKKRTGSRDFEPVDPRRERDLHAMRRPAHANTELARLETGGPHGQVRGCPDLPAERQGRENPARVRRTKGLERVLA